jgi:hypothetical protein
MLGAWLARYRTMRFQVLFGLLVVALFASSSLLRHDYRRSEGRGLDGIDGIGWGNAGGLTIGCAGLGGGPGRPPPP